MNSAFQLRILMITIDKYISMSASLSQTVVGEWVFSMGRQLRSLIIYIIQYMLC